MNITLDPGPFLKIIMPVIAVAGKSNKKCNYEDYFGINRNHIRDWQNHTQRAVASALSTHLDKNDRKTINNIKSSIDTEMGMSFEEKVFPLLTVTLIADARELIVSATRGLATASIRLSEEDLKLLHYTCAKEGKITIDSERLWSVLKYTSRRGPLTISSDCQCRVSMATEDGFRMDLAKFRYHTKLVEHYDAIHIASLPKSILREGISIIRGILGNEGIYRQLLMQISPQSVRFIGGDGGGYSVYDVEGIDTSCEKTIPIMFDRSSINPILAFLQKLESSDILIAQKRSSQKEYPRLIILKQGINTLSILSITKGNKYSLVDAYLAYDFKYKVHTRLGDWHLLMGDRNCPGGIAGCPTTKITADFMDGQLIVEHGRRVKSISPVPILYPGEIPYLDLKSVKEEELRLECLSKRLCFMVQAGKPQDIVSIQFGCNRPGPKKLNSATINAIALVTYPIRTHKSSKTTEQLYLFFPRVLKNQEEPAEKK